MTQLKDASRVSRAEMPSFCSSFKNWKNIVDPIEKSLDSSEAQATFFFIIYGKVKIVKICSARGILAWFQPIVDNTIKYLKFQFLRVDVIPHMPKRSSMI